MAFESKHEIIVEWGDCDPAGIVYYPNYYRWMDQATFRLFQSAGLARDPLIDGQWTEGTPLVEAKCAFRRASQHGERLSISSFVSRWGTSSFTVTHVFRDASGEISAEGYETRIWARKQGNARTLKSVPIPAAVRTALG